MALKLACSRPFSCAPTCLAPLALLAAFLVAAQPAEAGKAGAGMGDPILSGPSGAPRSRLYVLIPGYEAYYAPPATAPKQPGGEQSSIATPAIPAAAATVPAPALPVTVAPAPAPAPAAAALTLPEKAAAAPRSADALDSLAVAATRAGEVETAMVVEFTGEDTQLPVRATKPLLQLAERLRQDPTMLIALNGFAAPGDSAVKLRRLAMWRARTVRAALLEHGVPADRIRLHTTEGEGREAAIERVDVKIIQP